MPNDIPPISMQFDDSGQRVVVVDGASVSTPKDLISTVPGLMTEDYAIACAQMLVHLSQGAKMTLIVDPADYKAEYDRIKAAEDPDEEPRPGVVRLHNYGVPDFDAIEPPALEGDKLVFYTSHNFYKLPYRVEVGADGKPTYQPMPLQ